MLRCYDYRPDPYACAPMPVPGLCLDPYAWLGAPISCCCKDPQSQPPALSCDQNCQRTWKVIRDSVTGVLVFVLVCVAAF